MAGHQRAGSGTLDAEGDRGREMAAERRRARARARERERGRERESARARARTRQRKPSSSKYLQRAEAGFARSQR
jgi:hypothetical protein